MIGPCHGHGWHDMIRVFGWKESRVKAMCRMIQRKETSWHLFSKHESLCLMSRIDI